jgi:putative ABC transport system permease protein
MLYSVVMQPLPFADADRMIEVTETFRGADTRVGPGQYHRWTQQASSFESLSAHLNTAFNLTSSGVTERISAAWVTPSFFDVHYVPPFAGRYFLPEEGKPGGAKVVVISHALSQQRFAGDRSVIGRSIALNQELYTIVGVAPAAYEFAPEQELLWAPLALTAEHVSNFDQQWLEVHGKLRPGVTIEAAQQELLRITANIAQENPGIRSLRERSVHVYDFRAELIAAYDRQLTVLFGAVAFVLILAWFNVANLLLARVTTRRKEMAIRAALGASRSRLIRQFLTEALVIAVLSGVAAFLVARFTITVLIRLAPSGIPRLSATGIGLHLFAFLVLVTFLSAVFIGVLTALRGTRNLQPTLRQGGRGSSSHSTRDPLRSTLVISEVALALVLLTGAGLFVRSAVALHRIDPGFDSANVITARLSLSGARYTTGANVIAGFERVLQHLAALPGVAEVGATSQLPLEGVGIELGVFIEGRTFDAGEHPRVALRAISPGYFESLRASMKRGRAFTAADRTRAAPVAIVNDLLAAQLWPNENPIGKRVSCCGDSGPGREIVGVAATLRESLTSDVGPQLFIPIQQMPPQSWLWLGNTLVFTVRTRANAATMIPALKDAVSAIDPAMPLHDLRTLDQVTTRATAANRFSLMLFSSFAALALVLASVGIYGVLAYFVSQRTQEIGVRVALGARRADVIALILNQGARLTIAGLIIGLVLAGLASRALESMLFGVTPGDPLTYVAVTVVLGSVAIIACYVPARRAAAVNPADTIRA